METWYLKKHDDESVHGPVPLDQLRDWSLSAKISPLDKVSYDDKWTWLRAPMVPELHMDWLVEVTPDFLYGPTTFGTVQEFLAAGEISEDTYILNCVDGRRAQIKEMAAFRKGGENGADPGKVTDRLTGDGGEGGGDGGRIRQLEDMLVQQRRALEEAELRYQRLRVKYIEKTGENP